MNKDHHDEFESKVVEYLTRAGCMVEPFTYHERMTSDACRAISRCYQRSALRVRLHPDLLVFSPDRSRVAFVEVKAPPRHDKDRTEMHVEALQAIYNAELGDVVYAVRFNDKEVGWDCDSFDQSWIDEIRIPVLVRRGFVEFDRLDERNYESDDGYAFYERAVAKSFPRAIIKQRNWDYPCPGSGDPYLVLRESAVASMRDWRQVIAAKLNLPDPSEVIASIPVADGNANIAGDAA